MPSIPTYKIERISPAKARAMLKKNIKNRPLQKTTVDFFAAQMRGKDWDPYNGEAIKFNGNGTLVDGQHRLAAIILVGRTIPVMVCRGVSSNAFKTIDTGRKRHLADCLAREGYQMYQSLAGAIRVCASIYEQPFYYRNVTNSEGMDIIKEHPRLVKSVDFIHHGATKRYQFARIVGLGRLAGFHYVAATRRESDWDTADWFVDRLLMGDELKKNSPILAYRAEIIALQKTDYALPRANALMLLVKTWNAWRLGKKPSFKTKPTDSLEME